MNHKKATQTILKGLFCDDLTFKYGRHRGNDGRLSVIILKKLFVKQLIYLP